MAGPHEHRVCRECGCRLTAVEVEHYEDRCEDCEGAWLEQIEAWRHGAEDEELDRLFGSHPDKAPH